MQSNSLPVSLSKLAARHGPLPLLVILAALGSLAWISGAAADDSGTAETGGELVQKRQPSYSSVNKIVSVVEMTNEELRNLKREFMEQITDTYFQLKLDGHLGYERARDNRDKPSLANVLMGEEFATILIKRHIIMRRLYTGLKVLFTKMLPMKVLVKLVHEYAPFEWLKSQEQVNVRPLFPGAQEQHLAEFYGLIELRAQVRAAEDMVALTSDNLRRILEVARRFLKPDDDSGGRTPLAAGKRRDAMTRSAKLVLEYYLREVFDWYSERWQTFEAALGNLSPRLVESIGNKRRLLDFIDHVIDADGLDINLNQEAKSFENPPTITEKMIVNIQDGLIPQYVLKSLADDRSLLLANHGQVYDILYSASRIDADLYDWTTDFLALLCQSAN